MDNPFVTHADAYDEWSDTHREVAGQQRDPNPQFLITGIGQILVIGCGSGRFSLAHGIQYGINPTLPLGRIEYHRVTGVIRGDGEALPVQTPMIS